MGYLLTVEDLKKIERMAKEHSIKEIVAYLKNQLGARLTTYLSGRSDAKVLDLWISGKEKPGATEELRLRNGYWAAALVVGEYDAETARALFWGTAELLNDKAPASWLRDHSREEDLKLVVNDVMNWLYR